MPARFPARLRGSPWLQALGLFVGSLALAVAVHGFSLSFGFDYDDYHLLRPYTPREVAATFHGPWDPSGIEVPFYRPLTTTFYAARFWVLGVDAWKYHALSLLMFGGAAALFGLFAALVAGRWWAGALTAAVYVLHPAMPRSQVVWATNQMHLLSSLVVGATLAWWAARGRSGRGWWWAIAATVVAFLIKEDGIMLLPLVVGLQLLWRTLVERGGTWPPLKWVAAGALAVLALLALRYAALGGVGGYTARPTLERMWVNYQPGARIGFLAMRSDRWYLWPWAETFVKAVLAAGVLACVLLRQARLAFLLFAGVLGAALFNLPFVLVTTAEQYHLIASFSAVSIAAALAAVGGAIPRRWWRVTIGATTVTGLLVLAAASRHRGELFTPYTTWTMGHDTVAADWPGMPAEIREWLREGLRERRQPAIGPLSNLPVIVFGAPDVETDPQGRKVRWLRRHTTILPNAGVGVLELPLLASLPAGSSCRVVVATQDGPAATVSLRDAESVTVKVPVRQRGRLFALARRVTITVTPEPRAGTAEGTAQAPDRAIGLGEIRCLPRRR